MAVHLSSPTIKNHYGIEVTKSLKWDQWEPGGEYTQLMTLKNVNSKTKKLKYRIRNTNFFTTRYPQPIILSSGMSIDVPVTFRPLKKDKYEDSIEFQTKEGQFKVSMKAILPESSLNLPEMIKFGMCAVKDQLSIPFQISNTSDLQVTFQLKTSNPFSVKPTSGTLAPKTHCEIVAVFKPEGALVYEVDTECVFGNDQNETKIVKSIKMEGIGKYIHLGISYGEQRTASHDISIDYGTTHLGNKVDKSFRIKNLSPVDAPFQIMPKSSMVIDNVFSCSKYHGVIPAEGSTQIKLSFKPELHNQTYVENFDVLAVGMASKSCIKCVGKAIGPSVCIENDLVNFGITNPSHFVTRSFKLKNNLDMDAVFQFKINSKNSVFKMNVTNGVIEANSTKTIHVKFSPNQPMVYYRKVFCLIENQEPITVELYGTCHTNESKPVVLSKQHVLNYKEHVQNGVSRMCPEEIMELLSNGQIELDQNHILQIKDEEVSNRLQKPERTLDPYEQYFAQCQEQDDPQLNQTSMITVDNETIDFGKCKEDSVIQRTINLSNNTFGQVTCVWMNGEGKFQMTPERAEIEAMSTLSFRVVFKPDEVSKYYNDEIEAFVFYKSMRDHRLVDERIITPPWCLAVNLMGHTFPKQKENFLPVCKWASTKMVFPPISDLTQSVYRTCLLMNNGQNPIHYTYEDDPTKVFSCKPNMDLVRDQYHLIIFKMSAMEYGTNKRTIKCRINDMDKFTENFEMVMSADQPDILMTPKEMMFFKPTCVGSFSQQTVKLTNKSRVPLRCQWKVSKVDEPHLSVDPPKIIILPNEIQEHKWTFTPNNCIKHLFKTKLLVSTADQSENDQTQQPVKKYVLRMIGEGETGQLKCPTSDVDFGEISVGHRFRKTVVIHNQSKCSLHYKLFAEQRVVNMDDLEELPHENLTITLDHEEFVLPSQASKKIHATMAPKRRAYYECFISYELVTKNNQNETITLVDENMNEASTTSSNKHPLFTTKSKGVYPQLLVNDIRGSGCAERYSKKFLWELFHMDNLNTLLEMEPSNDELKYQLVSRHSTRRRMPVTTKAVNEINFSSSVYGSEPCCIYINLQNTGQSSVHWAIKYPTDFQLEMEYWSETGDLDPDELHEMYVMNSELFVVTPRSGLIKAGQSQTVCFVYNHNSLGTHHLPVMLKIDQGREIKLNFIGTTLEAHRHTLHFSSYDHYFAPVSIGTKNPSVQTYTLYNGSGQTTRFAFDTSILDLVEKDNYDHRILECLTPEGEIQPYQSLQTLWIFSPIEARSYTVGVPLLIENNENLVITFIGSGYDPYLMGDTVKVIDEDITLPPKQLVEAPNQLLKISSEYLVYGHISLNSESSQVIFLTNTSSESTISFHWILKGTPAEPFVTIVPSSGFLKPKEFITCKVTVFSQGPSANHDFDVKCEVIDETLTAQFKCDLKEWSKRREEKKHLFTIRDVTENKMKNNRPGSQTSKRLVSVPSASLTKYEALPPIKAQQGSAKSSKSGSAGERRVIVEERPHAHDENDIKPLPPRSFISHLGVRVTTHATDEYQMLCTEDRFNCTFVQRNPSITIPCNATRKQSATSNETHVVETLLKMLIQDMIHDEDFRQRIIDMENEPVPYYAMLTPDLLPLPQEADEDEDAEDDEMESVIKAEMGILEEKLIVEEEENNGTEQMETERMETTPMETEQIETEREEKIEKYSSEELRSMSSMEERQQLKRNDEMRYIMNEVLESTLANIIIEANKGGFSLTNRPRIIAPHPPTDRSIPDSNQSELHTESVKSILDLQDAYTPSNRSIQEPLEEIDG